ncbi:MAG: alpha-L-fucosidase, partial [Candidatus Sumerlaeota bacterium]|nr:alpha-L-fucosidase [Candidatus Sumerlaeota bacterium]
MVQQTRNQFLKTMGLAAVSGLASPAWASGSGSAQPPGKNEKGGAKKSKNDPEAAVPSYLRGYEALYRENPRAAAVEWHRNAKWGLFIHYALESLRGLTASDALKAKSVSGDEWKKLKGGGDVDYARLKDRFTAEKFDADFITDLAREAGCRYVNITTRHHDGFCLWDSASEPFNTKNTPAKRDLVKELSDACARKGLGFLPYWSLGRDWRHPHAPPECRPPYERYYGKPDPHYAPAAEQDIEKYNQFVRQQVTELFQGYQLAGIWFDVIGIGLER